MTATKQKTYFKTENGKMLLGDSLDVLRSMKDGSVDLIMPSQPTSTTCFIACLPSFVCS